MPTTIITGGTGGIGAEIALTLLQKDPSRQVALVDLTVDEVPELLLEYCSRVGLYSCDVTDQGSGKVVSQQVRAHVMARSGL